LDATEGLDNGAERRAEGDEAGASKFVAGLRQRKSMSRPRRATVGEKILTLAPLRIDCLAALHTAAHEIDERVRQAIGAESYRQVPLLLDAVAGADVTRASYRRPSR
jgi:hypothetical protein